MNRELHLKVVYENNLDTDKFARMFNNKAQSYKFYWFEAILNLTKISEKDLTFEEIIDEMICEAWHTVTYYHLRLGPKVNGNAENFLEHAINTLNDKRSSLIAYMAKLSEDENIFYIILDGVGLQKKKNSYES